MLSAALTEINLSGELNEEDRSIAEGVAAGQSTYVTNLRTL